MRKQLFYFKFSRDLRMWSMEITANLSGLNFYKEFEKITLCKSFSKSETTSIVYSEPITKIRTV